MEDHSTDKKPDILPRTEGDPGAVRLGNFMNYYQFHPPEDRIKQLPTDVWLKNMECKIVCLDVGCNTGDLTQEMFQYVNGMSGKSADGDVQQKECFILGVDIDPILISRAEESNRFINHVMYKTLDIMTSNRRTVLGEYLGNHGKDRFDVIFCFSVTMWIHLNHGDKGLKEFLHNMCDMTELLVIEPQPWKCYLTAIKRLKKSNVDFPDLSKLRMNRRVDVNIEDIIQKKLKFEKIHESCPNSWGRRIVFFKRPSIK